MKARKSVFLVVLLCSCAIAVNPAEALDTSVNKLWERGIENFPTDFTVDNGKVFTVDRESNRCFDAETGSSIWNGSGSGYWAGRLAVSEGRVYSGGGGAAVYCFSEDTGQFLYSFNAPVRSDLWRASPPSSITVVDGRVFATAEGMNAHNVSTGQLLWEYAYDPIGDPVPVNKAGITYGWAFEGNLVFAVGSFYNGTGFPYQEFVFRLDPSKGTVLWKVPIAWADGAASSNGQLIIWTINKGQTTLLSLDQTTGSQVWSRNIQATIYEPTTYNGLLLFGAYDGFLYAINIGDGTLAWKTLVDDQNNRTSIDSGLPHYPLAPVASLIQADSKNDRLFWSFTFIENGYGGVDEYVGVLCSVDLSNGTTVWTTPIEKNITISHSGGPRFTSLGLVLFNNNLFLTAGTDLWILSGSDGGIIETSHFEHFILAPIVGNDCVFVAADLYLMAYEVEKVIPEPQQLEPSPTTLIAAIIAIVALGAVAFLVYFRKIKKTTGKTE